MCSVEEVRGLMEALYSICAALQSAALQSNDVFHFLSKEET